VVYIWPILFLLQPAGERQVVDRILKHFYMGRGR
jgi:hypothetical protein